MHWHWFGNMPVTANFLMNEYANEFQEKQSETIWLRLSLTDCDKLNAAYES